METEGEMHEWRRSTVVAERQRESGARNGGEYAPPASVPSPSAIGATPRREPAAVAASSVAAGAVAAGAVAAGAAGSLAGA